MRLKRCASANDFQNSISTGPATAAGAFPAPAPPQAPSAPAADREARPATTLRRVTVATPCFIADTGFDVASTRAVFATTSCHSMLNYLRCAGVQEDPAPPQRCGSP